MSVKGSMSIFTITAGNYMVAALYIQNRLNCVSLVSLNIWGLVSIIRASLLFQLFHCSSCNWFMSVFSATRCIQFHFDASPITV